MIMSDCEHTISFNIIITSDLEHTISFNIIIMSDLQHKKCKLLSCLYHNHHILYHIHITVKYLHVFHPNHRVWPSTQCMSFILITVSGLQHKGEIHAGPSKLQVKCMPFNRTKWSNTGGSKADKMKARFRFCRIPNKHISKLHTSSHANMIYTSTRYILTRYTSASYIHVNKIRITTKYR